MKSLFKIAVVFAAVFIWAPAVLARDAATLSDCYIKNFESNLAVQADGSLLIEEYIWADCGILPDKHGIFRIMPEQVKTDSVSFPAPVKLLSITNDKGNKLPYTETRDNFDHTVSYKIGDPGATITGENVYKIIYSVKNGVRAAKDGTDELYWNLTGNYWDMEIDSFTARVVFPEGISEKNSEVYLYSGATGEKQNSLADGEWINSNTLGVDSKTPLGARQGITLSVIFPAGIVSAHRPGFWDLYGNYLWLVFPLMVFVFAFIVWKKHGRDPVVGKTIIPEFEIPERLPPIQMALLDANGVFADKFIAASIVDLAVKKHIVIEEIKKTWAFGNNDYRLSKLDLQKDASDLTESESALMGEIFKTDRAVKISELKERFYLSVPKIRRTAVNQLIDGGYIANDGLSFKKAFLIVGFLFFWATIFIMYFGLIAALSFALTGVILIIFAMIMPKRTRKGAELNWRIQGFKLYMKTAEKYRQQFNEKENIFEKFLPYAMVFGMAKIWIKKMEELYGKDYFSNYHPAWYTGAAIRGFNADNFTSQIDSLSASIAANTGSASGAHGGGFSGGGGGGGGGGSW